MIVPHGILAWSLVLRLVEVTSSYFDLIQGSPIILASLCGLGRVLYSGSFLGLLVRSFFLWA